MWSNDGKILFLSAQECGRKKLFWVSAIPNAHRTVPTVLVDEGSIASMYRSSGSKSDNRVLVSRSSFRENSVFLMTDPSAGTIKVTSSLLSCQSLGIRATQISEVWYKGAGNYNVHAWVIRPWNYKEGEKYPSALLIHGGPLQSWLHT
jgi:dipeptidyl aminopeptidase/acylaminoacyl peptidase